MKWWCLNRKKTLKADEMYLTECKNMLINITWFLNQNHGCFRKKDQEADKKITGVLAMLRLLKKIFCLHIYEYQQMEEIGADWECRKCGTQRD